jgi:hypothetical protein
LCHHEKLALLLLLLLLLLVVIVTLTLLRDGCSLRRAGALVFLRVKLLMRRRQALLNDQTPTCESKRCSET